jgi:hypothetical protein
MGERGDHKIKWTILFLCKQSEEDREREREIHIYREKKRVGNKEKFLGWLADALSIPFPRSQNKEKTSCRFAKGGKIYSPVLVSKEKKKQLTNECTRHSLNVANEKKRGTPTTRPKNRGIGRIGDYFSFFSRPSLCIWCRSFKKVPYQ